jgi:predicted outer membrane repeat protein
VPRTAFLALDNERGAIMDSSFRTTGFGTIGWWLLLALAGAPRTAAAQPLTYLVGADAAVCDFAVIQAAIDAAQLHPGPDRIRIADDQSYAGLALKLGAQDLTIEGGYSSCAEAAASTTPPSARTTLSGSGGLPDSVIEITGSGERVLRGLTLRGGDDPVSGGGLQFDGAGDVYLERVSISSNASAFGAGINFHAPGSPANLIFVDSVLVQNNTASESGGGIRVTGNAFLFLSSDLSAVIGNVAEGQSSDQQGHGGGVLVVGPAQAHIAAAGVLNQGAIRANRAKYGGGLAVIGSEDGAAAAFLYTIDPQRPLWIDGNSASIAGGAVYTDTYQTLSQDATVYAWGVRIENNRAPEGAAIEVRGGSDFYLNASRSDIPGRPGVASDCAPGVLCNRIRGNRSEAAGGAATQGAVVRRATHLQRVSLLDNVGGRLLQGVETLDTALVARNSASLELMLGAGFLPLALDNVTVVDNVVGADHLIDSFIPPRLTHSIVHQPGKTVATGPFDQLHDVVVSSCTLLPCSVADRVASFPSGARFVDPDGGDYRLHASSRAVDFAPAVPGQHRDLDGNPYDRDLPKPDLFGPRDLGAYERQDIGELVRNPFFAVDARLWTPASAAAGLQRDAGGAQTPGSLRVADANDVTAGVVIARQCVPLPGPGRYFLDGHARVDPAASPQFGVDRVSIRWRLFSESIPNDCASDPLQEGELVFASRSTFGPPLNPDAGGFDVFSDSEFSQVEIALIATEGSISLVDPTAGYFDDVRLFRLGPPQSIHVDGFEARE